MRSPSGFDLRGALSSELSGALEALETAPISPQAVHRSRVHLKRARALARVGKVCAPGMAAMFNQTARAAMAALSHTRDDAALIEIAQEAAKQTKKKQASALRALADALAAGNPRPPDIEAACANLRDLQALAQVWPEASESQIRAGARHIARRAARARDAGARSHDGHERHEWRKREKDRLYAAILLGDAWPGRRRRKRAEKICEALGAERDVRRLIDRLAANVVSAGSPKADVRALKALMRRLQHFSQRADRLARRF
jgi:CHAD domain